MVLSSLGKLSKLWFYSLMKSTAFLLVQLIQDVSRDKVTLSYTPQSYVPMSLGNSEKLPSFLLHAKLGIFIRKVYKKGLEFVVWIEDLGQWKVSPKVSYYSTNSVFLLFAYLFLISSSLYISPTPIILKHEPYMQFKIF